ncbi:unnamed protein product [Cuscuta epithymum]|uniref:glucan endo-1,3-beta-D-glucosidase n=1 Tax=Cuscuta epithymum TaxID=186058 RepID=A0AAV0ESC5_9ASTE|nr:unnamed protein product [Cuscuta epithymum]
MASPLKNPSIFFLLCFILQSFSTAKSEPFIGVNYGQVADNLPPPGNTSELLQKTSIGKVRLYGADPGIITALANTGIEIVIGAANGDIENLAGNPNPNFAVQWVNDNVIPYYPSSKIIVVTVGNEVMSSGDQNLISNLLPAMKNVQSALDASPSIGREIKVSTVHSMAVLSQSDPPSSGAFNSSFNGTMMPLLQFLKDTGAPLMINPYPYFAYQSDQRPETLAFCLFQPNDGRPDNGNQKTYMNMFDAQVDAVYSALNAMGFDEVQIVVAETGWPTKGDHTEAGATVDNAKAYNGNLINHLRSMVGTPLMPGKSVDTYIFALYDEDLKPGIASERSFGIFKPDLSMAYDIGLLNTSQTPSAAPVGPATPSPVESVTPAPTTVVNPLSPAYQAGVSSGNAVSCRDSHSLQLILAIVVGALMMEDKLLFQNAWQHIRIK